MASANLLALLDDIATMLDDIATMTKVATKKTAGVLGDDLAVNAQRVSGVRASRELPVVWAVCKGSLINKAILVPAALAISAVAPWLIMPLLTLGGLYLCFEGAEKLFHREPKGAKHAAAAPVPVLSDEEMIALEKRKIKGAVRTDFILSAEIIVISLGTVQHHPFATQVVALSFVAVLLTLGVYGLVAAIVKIDDVGLWLVQKNDNQGAAAAFGRALLNAAPKLMKSLGVIGTVAMFLVGGSIVTHALPHALIEPLVAWVTTTPAALAWLLPLVGHMLVGIVAGALVLVGVIAASKLFSKKKGVA